jgi:hypothetical protein
MLTMLTREINPLMNRATATRIDEKMCDRMDAAAKALNLKPADLLRVGLVRVLEEFESTGRLALVNYTTRKSRKGKGVGA